MSGQKIIDGLKDAIAGNYARVTIDGQQWIREDRAEATLLRKENGKLQAEIERLRAALKECADDLEAELNGRYANTLDYPSQRIKYDRDMTSVRAARTLLGNNEQIATEK